MTNAAEVLAQQIIRHNQAIRRAQKAQEETQDEGMFGIMQDCVKHLRAKQDEDYSIVRQLGLQSEVGSILRANDETAF